MLLLSDNEEPASSTPKFHRQYIGNRPTLGSQQIYYAPEVEVHDSSQVCQIKVDNFFKYSDSS